jgi:hypothetical protein
VAAAVQVDLVEMLVEQVVLVVEEQVAVYPKLDRQEHRVANTKAQVAVEAEELAVAVLLSSVIPRLS